MKAITHQDWRSPADLYLALQRSAPVRFCNSLVPDRQFVHQVGFLDLGQTVLVSQSGTPTDFLVEHSPTLHLLAVFGGTLHLQTDGCSFPVVENGAVLLPTGLRRSQGSHSLASITLHPAEVAAAAAAMAGPPQSSRKPPIRETFAALHLKQQPAGIIHSLMRTIDACATVDQRLLGHLALDDVIHRTAAALLHPALLLEEPADLLRYRDQIGRTSFDDLIDYIHANLDQPLPLSDLETRSHYSRRALQYAFRARLNSTPKQWIREQRLSLAMEQLQGDGPRPTISAVALRCGYLHLSQFSRDFRQRFGISPSQARRL